MKRPWCSVKGFLCWYWQGDISAARRLLLRGLRSCDYCPGIALVQSLAFSGNWHAQTYLALSQEYLRLELAYLINFEQRRLFLGIRDKNDFVNKAVWTCSLILFLLSFMFWRRSWQKAVARAIMSSAMLRHQGLHNINAPHFHMFWESQDIAIAGDRIVYQQLIGIIKKPMVGFVSFQNFELLSAHFTLVSTFASGRIYFKHFAWVECDTSWRWWTEYSKWWLSKCGRCKPTILGDRGMFRW